MVKRWKRIVADSLFVHAPKQSLTPTELMTMASIVEAEARLASERDTIAGVYLNRLKIGMKLDADPTVQYALGKKPGRVLFKDLRVVSPYNTYLNVGLPPGPIASPGAASIEAALHPAKVPYRFFVAAPDGHHEFRRTFTEHEAAIAMVREANLSEKAQRELDVALKVRSAFLAQMSHEIRTPLNAILGLAYLLERGKLPAQDREQVRQIAQAGKSLHRHQTFPTGVHRGT